MASDKIREALKRIAALASEGQESRNLTPEEQRGLSAALAKSGTVIGTIPLAQSIPESAALPQSPQEGMVLVPKAALEDAINLIIALKPHKARFVLEAMIAASSHSQEQEGKS